MFPGGGIDHKESAIEAAKREAMEECDREVRNCTPAHAPTVQAWPDNYEKKNSWATGYDGGLTYWMTGSCSEDPIHEGPGRHPDYEDCFEWKPISEVMTRLAKDTKGDWAEDAKTRMTVLQSYLDIHKRHKEAMASRVHLQHPAATPTLGVIHA